MRKMTARRLGRAEQRGRRERLYAVSVGCLQSRKPIAERFPANDSGPFGAARMRRSGTSLTCRGPGQTPPRQRQLARLGPIWIRASEIFEPAYPNGRTRESALHVVTDYLYRHQPLMTKDGWRRDNHDIT